MTPNQLPENYSVMIESENFSSCKHNWVPDGTCEYELLVSVEPVLPKLKETFKKIPVKQIIKKCLGCDSVMESGNILV